MANIIQCPRTVEGSGNAARGAHWDVINTHSSDNSIFITSFVAGARYDNNAQYAATLYACTHGGCAGNEKTASRWETVWTGHLKGSCKSTTCILPQPVSIQPGCKRGFLLHCPGGYVCFSAENQRAQDANVTLEPCDYTNSKQPFQSTQPYRYHRVKS